MDAIIYILTLIFILISGLHFYWIFGGKAILDAAIPVTVNGKKTFEAPLLPTLIVAIGLLFFALIILSNLNTFNSPLPSKVIEYGTWTIAIIFLLRAIGDFKYCGIRKTVKKTKFAKFDSMYYVPLCFIIGLGALLLAYNR